MMVAILRLIWGALSRVLPGVAAVLASATTLFVASAGARALAVAAGIATFVLWLPMPAWLESLPSLVGQIPAGVVYVMDYARVREGVGIVLGAYSLRFAARLALKVFG